jgi:hypothetical protein
MKTEDVLTAGVAFAAVVGLGMWYRQSRGVAGAPAAATGLPSVALPGAQPSLWNTPAPTVTDADDAYMGMAMHALNPSWGVVDQDDADAGLAMRGMF